MQPQRDPDFTGRIEHIAADIARQGWSVQSCMLPDPLPGLLRDEAMAAWQSGCFRHAGVGRGDNWELKPEVRSDKVLWLDELDQPPAIENYLAILESLRHTVNRYCMLGLFDFEGHLAVYPPGTRYRKHLDQFRDLGHRKLTTILYLNHDWQEADGGQLRLYLDDDASQYREILPLAGTVVSFLSEQFYHEVLPANRERYSITGWFRTRP